MNEQKLQFSRDCKWNWPLHLVQHLVNCTHVQYQNSYHVEIKATVNKHFTCVGLCKKSTDKQEKFSQSCAILANFGSSLGIARDYFWTNSNSSGSNSMLKNSFYFFLFLQFPGNCTFPSIWPNTWTHPDCGNMYTGWFGSALMLMIWCKIHQPR